MAWSFINMYFPGRPLHNGNMPVVGFSISDFIPYNLTSSRSVRLVTRTVWSRIAMFSQVYIYLILNIHAAIEMIQKLVKHFLMDDEGKVQHIFSFMSSMFNYATSIHCLHALPQLFDENIIMTKVKTVFPWQKLVKLFFKYLNYSFRFRQHKRRPFLCCFKPVKLIFTYFEFSVFFRSLNRKEPTGPILFSQFD